MFGAKISINISINDRYIDRLLHKMNTNFSLIINISNYLIFYLFNKKYINFCIHSIDY